MSSSASAWAASLFLERDPTVVECEVFRMLDTDKDGHLTLKELEPLLTSPRRAQKLTSEMRRCRNPQCGLVPREFAALFAKDQCVDEYYQARYHDPTTPPRSTSPVRCAARTPQGVDPALMLSPAAPSPQVVPAHDIGRSRSACIRRRRSPPDEPKEPSIWCEEDFPTLTNVKSGDSRFKGAASATSAAVAVGTQEQRGRKTSEEEPRGVAAAAESDGAHEAHPESDSFVSPRLRGDFQSPHRYRSPSAAHSAGSFTSPQRQQRRPRNRRRAAATGAKSVEVKGTRTEDDFSAQPSAASPDMSGMTTEVAAATASAVEQALPAVGGTAEAAVPGTPAPPSTVELAQAIAGGNLGQAMPGLQATATAAPSSSGSSGMEGCDPEIVRLAAKLAHMADSYSVAQSHRGQQVLLDNFMVEFARSVESIQHLATCHAGPVAIASFLSLRLALVQRANLLTCASVAAVG
eukprot:gnl/TRDRNA2_/TRDRNA2_166307_c1_seq1.p1 gnl/TRDRNA2_/TRDRNA2_166307_c1~~gnl/TRDRNA2_/TRDRNA2_166307_c1_seq1.p1  ORF type:complete len:463 (+),score=76.71 gnl/TRDRNA2_/TRDRNA2_166307_c1_seq1:114-1502(+)